MTTTEAKAIVAIALKRGWCKLGPPMRPTTDDDVRRARTAAMHEAGLNTRGGPPQKRGPKAMSTIPAEIAMEQHNENRNRSS